MDANQTGINDNCNLTSLGLYLDSFSTSFSSSSNVGVTSSTPVESVPVEESVVKVSEPQDVSLPTPIQKHCWISPTPIWSSESPIPSSSSSSSDPSTKSVLYPIIMVPELTIPVEAYHEWLNQPSGGKEYQCQLWHFYVPFLWHLRSYWPEGCQVTS